MPLILTATAAALAGYFVFFPLTDGDIFWHLAAAREMVRRGAFLTVDPFSYTPRDPRWINMHWLFQLSAYAVERASGLWGLVWAKCLLTAISAGILVRVAPGRRAVPIAAILAAGLLFEARFLVLARPGVVTVLCMAWFLWSLERYVDKENPVYLWWLIPVQVL